MTGHANLLNQDAQGSYAPVNGLQMYYEVHGTGRPLVLLHGAFSAIGTSFGRILPSLARTRQVIAVEQQAHGRTADIDRPLRVEQMADDTVALLRHLGIDNADVFGYSMGAAVGLQMALRHPDLVRKLVFMSAAYALEGVHPGLMEGLGEMQPEMMHGSQWHEEYLAIAPRPQDFPALFAKKQEMDRNTPQPSSADIEALRAPTLIMLGDSDLVRPEHAVEMFRLRGGGVFGDLAGLPSSQLAILPGTTHVSIAERADWLVPMVEAFLDAPLPGSV
jgi:pimeloyl-ACP methyl ester carboxylesterase